MEPDYGRRYEELYKKHWWWRAREAILCDELRRMVTGSRPISILDVGCGNGLFFERLREFGDVEGIEPAGELVDPRSSNFVKITVAPFDASFKPGKKYDLILMLDVLEHLDAAEEALRHALSLLALDGKILVTVPSFCLLWTNHDRVNQHRTRYTKRSFALTAKAAGMEVLAKRYFFTWLFFAKLAVRLKESVVPMTPLIPRVPSPAINRFLYVFSLTEEKVIRNLHLPIGSSLLVVGRRASANRSA